MLCNIRFVGYKTKRICKTSHHGNVYKSSRQSLLRSKRNRVPDYIPHYTSCYESLLEFEEIITRARKMESAAKDIRKKKKLPHQDYPYPLHRY